MNDLFNALSLFLILGTITIFIVIVIRNILYWIAPMRTRTKRLNIIVGVIFGVLGIMLLIKKTNIIGLLNGEKGDGEISGLFIGTSKIMMKLLMLGAVVVSVIMLLAVLFLLLFHGCKALKKGENEANLAERLKNKSNEIKAIIRTPIIIFAITWGIIALFFIFPILMGNQEDDKNWSMAEVWKDGVYRIASFIETENKEDLDKALDTAEDIEARAEMVQSEKILQNNGKAPFYEALITYILIFIIVLGVGIATIRILYSIISSIFTKKNNNTVIDEYSSSIGILAVGIALLLTVQNIDIFKKSASEIILEFLKTFGVVVFVIALIILTLELIRLLMDMKEELIRQEAKYLFISLVGQVAVLMLDIINSLYLAVSSAIGNTINDDMDETQDMIRQKMMETQKSQLNNVQNDEITFSVFNKKVTKK